MFDAQNSESAFRIGIAPHSESESHPAICMSKRNAVGPKSAFRNGISLKTKSSYRQGSKAGGGDEA
jgi:hypothetical protein